MGKEALGLNRTRLLSNFYTTKKKATVLDALPLNISPKPIFMALLQNFKK
ncbi:hypothetical protein KAF80_27155 [Bacillus sp. WL1]|nr:hypothetical protein [Bacillus sp. WL1]MEC2714930.1 hypothetical protein [Bacillus cereus]MBP3972604.1 hypothetical protein [Bacillus sp. WL1]MEC2745343.1 hypothetical protein [Bacillus cereus]MEC2758388.1 hypothetical protein [Bacillus cereus]MEC2829993.1 hypothetical protein [Bacillus cereus]